MRNRDRCAKINLKVLLILTLVVVALGTSLFAARQIRRSILSKKALSAGEAAFEKKDWEAAHKNFREYLGRNPDDVEILKKYAKARLSIRPLDARAIAGAISAYRRVMQLAPLDEIAYDKLAMLYVGIGNLNELAYIARTRIKHVPNDRKAPLWLADALIGLNKPEEARLMLDEFITELEALPDNHVEYVRACVRRSSIADSNDSPGAEAKVLEWLNKAVDYDSESIEALVYRARFYREKPNIPGMADKEMLKKYGMTMEAMLRAARKDLEDADDIGTDNPRIRAFLYAEWMAHDEFDLAEAELQAVENLTNEALEEYFFDISDWTVTKFLLASERALRRKATAKDVSLADDVLTELTEKRHRVQVLPSAIGLYINAGKVVEARQCLDEYLDAMYTRESRAVSKLRLAYLQALVAKAEDKAYVVIDVLQPAAVSDTARPELWQLLAEAYSRTDQTRRAVSALLKYLFIRPRDPEMTLQLAKEYLKLQDWNRAFQTARLAEPLDPTNIIIRLLRIEASIYRAAEQSYQIEMDEAKLKTLSDELVKMRKEHPDRVDIRILQAIIEIYLEQPEKAETELKLAIEECEEPLRAEMQLVRYYYRAKDMNEAVSVCLTACERHSEIAEPWLALAGLHVASEDYDTARSCLNQGLDASVGKWEKRAVSMRLAMVEILYGDRVAGISLLEGIAKQDEQEIRARSLLLGIREVREDKATADRLIEELRTAEGESGLLWRLNQASLWLSADDWRSKQQDIAGLLRNCIDSDPQWSSPVLLLVDMYERLDNVKRIEDTCRQALARNPSATDITDRLVTLLEKQGRFSDAEKVLDEVEAKNPRVASAWRVRTALGAGDFSKAIVELKLRVQNDDRDVNSRILLARLVYWQDNDLDQALALLDGAEAIASSSMALIAARVSILRAEGDENETHRILNEYVANNDEFGAYMMRGAYLANEGEGEFERAEKDYRKLTTFAGKGAIGYELLSNFYVRKEKLDKAVETLEEGLGVYPASLRLRRRLMKTLLRGGQPQDREKALEILATLEKLLPKDPELMKFRALQMLEDSPQQSRETARRLLEDVVKLEPTALDAHRVLISMAMQDEDYETARDCAIRALGSNPENLALLSARGRAEFALGNTQMAAELAKLAIQKDPNNVDARNLIVAAALKSEDSALLEMATESARRALQEDPNNAKARDAIVAVALKTKDETILEEARELIESALDANSADEELLISRARVMVALKQPEIAIPELNAYCQTEEGSNSIPALVTLADLYRLSGDMDQAEQRIVQAEKLNPNSQTVVHARFVWLLAQKRYNELAEISSEYISAEEQNPTTLVKAASALAALDSMELKKEGIKLFEHVLTLSPKLFNARMGLAATLYEAATLYQKGDAERAKMINRAKKINEELLKEAPSNIRILNDLAWILQDHYDRYDAALELANKGLMFAPDELHLLDTRGTILSNLPDRLADAKKDFERLKELSQPDTRQRAKALLQLGRICSKLNDLVQAKQHLEKALEIDRKIDVFTSDERSEITRIIQ